MKKEQQNLSWGCLPKEVRAWMRNDYINAYEDIWKTTLAFYFGSHNLTSDTEPEEMLMVERKKVIRKYKFANICDKDHPDKKYWEGAENTLIKLFGDKCLPDNPNTPNSGVLKSNKEPSVQVEPKFKVGELAMNYGKKCRILDYNPDGKFPYLIHILYNNLKTNVSESDLEPYTEPISQNPAENCDNADLNSKSDNMEEKELNLIELLKGYEGMEIYSLLEGITYILKVDDSLIETSCEKYGEKGEVYVNDVCLLYPSRSLYEKYPLDARAAWNEWDESRKPKRVLQAQIRLISNDGKTIMDYECVEVEVSDIDMTQATEAVRIALANIHNDNR